MESPFPFFAFFAPFVVILFLEDGITPRRPSPRCKMELAQCMDAIMATTEDTEGTEGEE